MSEETETEIETNDLRETISNEIEKVEATEPVPQTSTSTHSPDTSIEESVSKAAEANSSDKTTDPSANDLPPNPEEQANTFGKQETEEQIKARIDRPPQSWRGEGKQHWAELPLAARKEVHRREQDMQSALRENAQAKEFIGSVESVVAPHLDWLKAENLNPLSFIGSMFQAEVSFRSGTPGQRAQSAADYLVGYGIDLNLLDQALSERIENRGQDKSQQVDYSQIINKAVEQRLAPIFQQQEHQEQQYLSGVINQFANQAGHEYLEDLREDMANLIDMAAMKGTQMDLSRAYNTALSMRPDLQQAANLKNKQQSSNQLRSAAQSISGSTQNPQLGQPIDPTNMRALLEANFGS